MPNALLASSVLALSPALQEEPAPTWAQQHYSKREVRIPMRDGVSLHAALYSPDPSPDAAARPYPILLNRTPYSVAPYGAGERERLGPSELFERAGYIFVYQDVRGCFQSEGEFVNVRPHLDEKRGPSDVDESSDTHDTITWLLANVPDHNGKVGMWGISYGGFYAAAGMIDAHPALVAVSPQAPIADWYFDDFRHHGAFWLPHAFNFFADFGHVRSGLTTGWPDDFEHGTPDGFQFFLEFGALANADARWFRGTIPYWNELLAHPDHDAYWQARNLRPHLSRVAPAVLTVGGWFDAEDLYGPLAIYREVEQRNPGVWNGLVMGPWFHGGWARSDGERLGHAHFGGKQSPWYRENVEFPFFEHHLKGAPAPDLAEATVFETGANRWRRFERWPPRELLLRALYVREGARLAWEPAAEADGSDAWVSDPAKPVPFSEAVALGMTREYMTDDQRFAARRPDVLVYQSEPLAEALTLAGPIQAELWVSTTGTDADFVVKLIDVFPPDAPDFEGLEAGRHMGNYHMLVRSEAIRGRYRRSYERPEPFVPGQPSLVDVELLDLLHTFQPGHRIQVQVQSTWFPLMDRNPQTWVPNVRDARPADFVAHTHRVHRSRAHATRLVLGVLPASGADAGAR